VIELDGVRKSAKSIREKLTDLDQEMAIGRIVEEMNRQHKEEVEELKRK